MICVQFVVRCNSGNFGAEFVSNDQLTHKLVTLGSLLNIISIEYGLSAWKM